MRGKVCFPKGKMLNKIFKSFPLQIECFQPVPYDRKGSSEFPAHSSCLFSCALSKEQPQCRPPARTSHILTPQFQPIFYNLSQLLRQREWFLQTNLEHFPCPKTSLDDMLICLCFTQSSSISNVLATLKSKDRIINSDFPSHLDKEGKRHLSPIEKKILPFFS